MVIVDMMLFCWGVLMVDGMIIWWLKVVGDCVEEGEVVCEVEIEKVNVEVEVFVIGMLYEIFLGPGVIVDVGMFIVCI